MKFIARNAMSTIRCLYRSRRERVLCVRQDSNDGTMFTSESYPAVLMSNSELETVRMSPIFD